MTPPVEMNVYYTDAYKALNLEPLMYQSSGACAMDLHAVAFDVNGERVSKATMQIPVRGTVTFWTGIHIALPVGYGAEIITRSSMGWNRGLTLSNSLGLIDSDFRGELRVKLINLSSETQELALGERAAQLIVRQYPQVKLHAVDSVEALGITERGSDGFGSTGRF